MTSSLARLALFLCYFGTLLQSYDHNCDGLLDFDEFSKGVTMCQLDDLFPRSLQRTLFDKIDTDKVPSLHSRKIPLVYNKLYRKRDVSQCKTEAREVARVGVIRRTTTEPAYD